MSGTYRDRLAEAVLTFHGRIDNPHASDTAIAYGTADAVLAVPNPEVERLHTWDGLLSLLDEHWPEDMIPTLPDSEDRDPGPRIVSLLRWVERLRQENNRLEQDALKVIGERDGLERLLDQFAYAVAPVEVIGEHSSGNDPWANALDMLAPASERAEQQRRADRAEAERDELRRMYDDLCAAMSRTGTQLAEAKKKVEDLSSFLTPLVPFLELTAAIQHSAKDRETLTADIERVKAILDNPPPGDTPEPNRSEP